MILFHTLVDTLIRLISGFDNKEVAFACFLGILGGGFLAWATFVLWPHRRLLRELRAAATEARKIGSDATLAADQRLAALGEAMRSYPSVKETWDAYAPSIRCSPARRGGFVSPIDARSWFAPDRLPGGAREAWCNTMASLSLTLGLLLTFVGLSAALFALGGAIEPAALRDGISRLLSISAAKFVTSIAGIMAFIGWTLAARLHASARERAVHGLAGAIDRAVPHLAPEALLLDQLEAAHESKAAIRQLSDDLNVALHTSLTTVVGQRLDAFQDAIAPALDRSMQPVVEAIRGMGDRVGTDNQAALQEMARGFLGGMEDAAGKEMRALAETLRESVVALAATKAGIGESGAEFGRSLQAAADGMAVSASRLAEAVDGRMAGIEARMRSLDDSLSAGAGHIDAAGSLMSERVSQGIEQALAGLAEAASENARAAQAQAEAAMAPVLAAMRELVEEVRGSAERTRGDLEAGGRSASADMARAAAEMSASAGRMTETFDRRMAEVEARMSRLDGSLASGAGHIDEAGSRMSESVAAGVEKAMAGLAAAGAENARATQAQAEAGMYPVLAALREIVAEVRGSAEHTRGELETGGRAASDAIAAAARAMGQDLGAAAASAGAAASDAFGEGARRLVSDIAEATGRHRAASDAVAERMDGIERALAAAEQGIARQVGSLDKAGASLTAAGHTMGTASDKLGATAGPVAETLRAVGLSLEAVKHSLAEANAAGSAARQMADAISATAQAAETSLRSYAQRFEDTDRSLAGTVETLRNGVIDLNGHAVTAFGTIEAELGKAMGSLGNAVEHLADTLADAHQRADA